MADEREERRSGLEDRRSPADELSNAVRFADPAVSLFWKWGTMAVTIVCAIFILGMQYQKFSALMEKLDKVEARQDKTDALATHASVDSQVALKMTEQQAIAAQTVGVEMDQWRGVFKAIAMIQQQGGGRVTLLIPEKSHPSKEREGVHQ